MSFFSKHFIFFLIFLVFIVSATAQDISGTWNGQFYLPGAAREWSFSIDLQQDDTKITGIGSQVELSKKSSSGTINSTFTIEGHFDGQQLTYAMKEVLYLMSGNGQCLADCKYRFFELENKYQFIGECNRNGVFYKNDVYKPNSVACLETSKTKVIFEKMKDLNGRKTELVEQIEVPNKLITIKVWDDNQIDGDIISLNLNGYWLLKDYKLSEEVKTIELEMPEESNDLILYAENLGRVPPNTAAVSVFVDGEEVKTLLLNSDKGKSEGIRIYRRN